MGFTQRIRSELIADRENQPHTRRRIRREPFGVYRPLTDEAKLHLNDVLLGAQHDVNKYLYWKDGVRFTIPPDLGVTFVTRRAIARAMVGGSLQRGFEPVQFKRRVSVEPALCDETLEVPIGELDWFGFEGRKLVAKLAPSSEHTQLLHQADQIADLLEETGAEVSGVTDPDHLTLYRYGTQRDFQTIGSRKRNRLNNAQQEAVTEIVQTHLNNAQIYSVALGGVVVGNSYSLPHEPAAAAS